MGAGEPIPGRVLSSDEVNKITGDNEHRAGGSAS
jgi:hypothetical protein